MASPTTIPTGSGVATPPVENRIHELETEIARLQTKLREQEGR